MTSFVTLRLHIELTFCISITFIDVMCMLPLFYYIFLEVFLDLCDVVAHFDLLLCIYILLSFFHDLIWITLLSFIYSSMIWCGLHWLHFFHDLICLAITFLLPWLDMAYSVNLLIFSPWPDMDLPSFISFPYVDSMFPIGFLWFILD